jgi:hypothetical protein
MVDGVYHIDDFEFTAFALIGVEPCFEGSALETFSKQDFKQQLSEMMQDLKESYSLVKTSKEVDDTHPQKYSTEGGEKVLEQKMELVARYGIDVDSLDFSIDDFTVEELTEKFEAMKSTDDNTDPDITDDNVGTDPAPVQDKFALTSNVVSEICRILDEVKIEREWGECTRYWYVDCDFDAHEVYCWDTNDWLLYGFTYAIDGDSVNIDYDSKCRKKYIIADFDEGEQPSPFAQVFTDMELMLHENSEWELKYQTASSTIATMESELDELRKFRKDTETAIAKNERDNVFAQFEDLNGIESFEALRQSCMEYDIETLEEKCYAIRGRSGTTAKFSLENKSPKIPVGNTETTSNEPYGGIFAKFGITND